MLTTQMPNTSSTESRHPSPKWYFSPFLYLVFPSLFTHMISGMNKRVVNPVTARICRHHQSRGPQRAPQKGLAEHDFLVDRVGMGPRFLLIGQHHISMGFQIGKDFLPKVFGWFKRKMTGLYVVFRRTQWQQSWQFFNLHLTKYQYE